MNQTESLFQCRHIFQSAMTALGVFLTKEKIEEISDLIMEGLTEKWRNFHTFNHILMLTNTGDPLITLAGLFHDLVYLQIDEKIIFNYTPYLNSFIIEKKDGFFIKSQLTYSDDCFSIVLKIFDVNLGDSLSQFKGQNEFLSALVAGKILQPYLPLSLITRIITMIELTIPFRQTKDENETIPQQLQKRLEIVNQEFNLDLSQANIITTICQAVKLANLDVSGFGTSNVQNFLKNTWLLLPETNHCLYDSQKYTIQDYRLALENTNKFINFISPNLVFHHYHNEPDLITFQELIKNCQNNLDISRLYLQIKLTSIALLEALSLHFCPNIPLNFFWNVSNNANFKYVSIFDFLPSILPYKPQNNIEKIILDLLTFECQGNIFPDISHSLFTIFILNYISFETIVNYKSQCDSFFSRQLTPQDFLSLFPPSLISIISSSIEQLLHQKQDSLRFLKHWENQ
ncbi:hypothetical protein [Geminocystis herdmanii]|uniref:hypothetical protein n=1 Tax=Geminocystis herdmanii TaxID=669359 RepID=UPI000348490C|nr:hypothetical protein [Geminocystis herdmanii]